MSARSTACGDSTDGADAHSNAPAHAGSSLCSHANTDARAATASTKLQARARRLVPADIDTKALVVHEADLVLVRIVTPLSADLVRHHRSRVVDRHALAPVEDAADEVRCEDVSLRRGVVM